MRNIIIVIVFALSLAPLKPCNAELGMTEIIQELRQAKSEAEMDKAIASFGKSSVKFVEELIALLGESKTHESKTRACFVIGETRNPRATRALIENLLVTAEVPTQYTRIPLWGRYPCQEALAKIGKPAEWKLIELLSGTEGGEMKAAALKVIQHIEGYRGAVFVLEQAWEKAGLEERKNLTPILERARKEAP